VHLDRPHPRVEPARQHPHGVARAERARPQRPSHHRADAAQRERAVDVQSRVAVRDGAADRALGHMLERGQQRVDPRALDRRHGHDRRARHELGGLRARALGVGGVRLRHGDDAVLDAELPQHRHVLARLRHHAVVGRDAEQEQVDPGRTRDHCPHEALVPRHVDDRKLPSVRKC
jgi:hypothetical protein